MGERGWERESGRVGEGKLERMGKGGVEGKAGVEGKGGVEGRMGEWERGKWESGSGRGS